MSDFVDQCRAEWKRLGVLDAIADEMAAELDSDLRAAEVDGVSAGEFLGSSATDPRAFAASWAAERGIVPLPPGRDSRRRRPLALVALIAVAAIAVIVAALLLATGEPQVALVTSGAAPHPLGASPTGHRVQASAAAPVEWVLLFVAVVALGFSARLWSRWSRSQSPSVPAQ
jgi:hypothetical protein